MKKFKEKVQNSHFLKFFQFLLIYFFPDMNLWPSFSMGTGPQVTRGVESLLTSQHCGWIKYSQLMHSGTMETENVF